MRAGFAYANSYDLHHKEGECFKGAELSRCVLWGAVFPVAIAALTAFKNVLILFALIYPVQIIRIASRKGIMGRTSWVQAFFLTLGKFAEFAGVVRYYSHKSFGRRPELIEYKNNP